MLSPLYVEDGFNGENESPRELTSRAGKGDTAAAERLRLLAATDSCPAMIIDVTPQVGSIERN